MLECMVSVCIWVLCLMDRVTVCYQVLRETSLLATNYVTCLSFNLHVVHVCRQYIYIHYSVYWPILWIFSASKVVAVEIAILHSWAKMSILFINSHTSRLLEAWQLKCSHVISARQCYQQSLDCIVTECSTLGRNILDVPLRWALFGM